MTLFAAFAAVAAALTDPSAAVAAPPTPAATPSPRRYCIVDTPTGSHIPVKTCRTLAEWQDEGIDTSGWVKP